MNKKQRQTLGRIFEKPDRSDIEWSDVEALFKALGGELSEGRGSRVRVALKDVRAVFHRPHPERVIDKGIGEIRAQISVRSGGEPLMEYKGYFGKVEFDDEANVFHGEVINLRDVITFEGKTVEELREAFHESIDDYLEFCAARGEDPEKPYSGKFVVRVDPELHKSIVVEARKRGKSLNSWVADALSKAIEDDGTQGRAR